MYLPFLHELFNTAPLGLREWAALLVCAPMMLLIDEARKALLRNRTQRTATSMQKSE
jgi:hypothetical protein